MPGNAGSGEGEEGEKGTNQALDGLVGKRYEEEKRREHHQKVVAGEMSLHSIAVAIQAQL